MGKERKRVAQIVRRGRGRSKKRREEIGREEGKGVKKES